MEAQPKADSALASAKAGLRHQAKQHRQQVGPLNGAALCAALRVFLHERLADSDPEPAWTVSYSSLPGEPDLSGLLALIGADSAPLSTVGPVALTRTPATGHTLTIHPADSDLERHRYGFDQPVVGSTVVPDTHVGVVLVPGLAFDRAGGRLGFGAGYYDRLLARLLARSLDVPEAANLAIVGISDGFLVERVPMGRLDIPMTHIATSAGVFAVRTR